MTRNAVDGQGTLTLLDLTVEEVDADTMTGSFNAGFDVWANRRRKEGELDTQGGKKK